MLQNPYQNLNDKQLVESLETLTHQDRATNAEIILHLIEVKARKLFVPAGYATLFDYCTKKLGFSKSSAYRRTAVAEKATEFPEIIDRLRDGRLHLCAAAAVIKYLAEDTAAELLDAVVGMSKNEVDFFIVKTWEPKLRRAAEKAQAGQPRLKVEETEPTLVLELMPQPRNPETSPTPSAKVPPPPRKARPRTDIKPLTETTNRVSITMSDTTVERLKRARELLAAKSDDEILRHALEKLLDQVAPERRHARREKRAAKKRLEKLRAAQRRIIKEQITRSKATRKPLVAARELLAQHSQPAMSGETARGVQDINITTTNPPLRQSRRGALKDRDQVVVEMGCRCSYLAKDGTQCQAKAFLEIDHIKPWSLGGASALGNFRPLCRAHHAYFSEQSFGRRPSAGHSPTCGTMPPRNARLAELGSSPGT